MSTQCAKSIAADKVLRVLVVDDDRHVVKTICDILRVKGYEPLPAFCGEEAVAKTDEDGLDCVLMLSGIDGIKALGACLTCI